MIFSKLASSLESYSKRNLACLIVYSIKSGGYSNALSRLVSLGLIERDGNKVKASSNGLEQARTLLGKDLNIFESVSLRDWLSRLKACERAIFKLFIEDTSLELSKEEIAEETGYSSGSGGFSNALSRLNSLGLIKRGKKTIFNQELLEGM